MTLYSMNIWWSDEDQCFIGETPELPGCMADGETPEECVRALGESAQLWIDVAVKLDRPVPMPRVGVVAYKAQARAAKDLIRALHEAGLTKP